MYPLPEWIIWTKTKNGAGVTHYNFVSGRWFLKIEKMPSKWYWIVQKMDKKGLREFGAEGDASTSKKAKDMAETIFRLYT